MTLVALPFTTRGCPLGYAKFFGAAVRSTLFAFVFLAYLLRYDPLPS